MTVLGIGRPKRTRRAVVVLLAAATALGGAVMTVGAEGGLGSVRDQPAVSLRAVLDAGTAADGADGDRTAAAVAVFHRVLLERHRRTRERLAALEAELDRAERRVAEARNPAPATAFPRGGRRRELVR
jgi:hypothetical protein